MVAAGAKAFSDAIPVADLSTWLPSRGARAPIQPGLRAALPPNAYNSENKSVLLHAVPTRYPTRVWELWIRDASQEAGEADKWDRQHVGEVHVLFGANLRQARLKAKLSQAEVAARTGMGQPYISDIENGVRDITLGTMTSCARPLGPMCERC